MIVYAGHEPPALMSLLERSLRMYTRTDFRTKKALKDAVAAGEKVAVYQPNGDLHGAHGEQTEGKVYLEGPHFPQPHTWYAQAMVTGGIIVPGTVK